MAHHAPSDAVERLQRAVPYDFAMPGTAFFAKFGGLYPAYVRGEAYLAAGRGQEATAEFQKVLNHRGIVLADPIGALAHLQLGRAYVVSGDVLKAKSAYQDFLTLWKNADPDIPILNRPRWNTRSYSRSASFLKTVQKAQRSRPADASWAAAKAGEANLKLIAVC